MTGAEEDIWYEKTEVTDPSCGKWEMKNYVYKSGHFKGLELEIE
jgi:hypothetical protein